MNRTIIVRPEGLGHYEKINADAQRLWSVLTVIVPQITWEVDKFRIAKYELPQPHGEVEADQEMEHNIRRGRWTVRGSIGPVALQRRVDMSLRADEVAVLFIKALARELSENLGPDLKAEARDI